MGKDKIYELNFYACANQYQTVYLGQSQYDKRYNCHTKAVKAFLPLGEINKLKVDICSDIIEQNQNLRILLDKAIGDMGLNFYTHEIFRDGYSQGMLIPGHRFDISCAACNESNKGKLARQTRKEILQDLGDE